MNFKSFSIASIIRPVISLLETPSMPSRPGDELTSRRSGLFFPRIISTPATFRFKVLAYSQI